MPPRELGKQPAPPYVLFLHVGGQKWLEYYFGVFFYACVKVSVHTPSSYMGLRRYMSI